MTLAYREPSIPDSVIARWDPRWKLASLGLAILLVALLQSLWPALVALLLAVGLVLAARLPWAAIRDRLLLMAFAVAPPVVILPLTSRDESAYSLGWLELSLPALLLVATLALRAFAIGLIALVLVRSETFPRTLSAAQALRLPSLLVQVTMVAHRYSLLFFEEARRLRIALRTRGFRVRSNLHSYRTLGQSVGSLLVHGGERADRVADAMRCRGYHGKMPLFKEFHARPIDGLMALLWLCLIAGLVVWDRCGVAP